MVALLLAVACPRTASGAPSGDNISESFENRRARLMSDLAALRFEALGDPVLRKDSLAPVYAPVERPHELLVVLVEFADRRFDRFSDVPEARARGEKLAAHYRKLLFDPAYRAPGSLSHYFRTQSLGTYHVQGRVLPPVRLSRPRAHYGAALRPPGGDWRHDSDPAGLVEEALTLAAQAHPDLDPAVFDRWDPRDFDGDGVRAEADGYLDHLMILYAGGDQSACSLLYRLEDRLTRNAGSEVLSALDPAARECTERLWPHRGVLERNPGQGPVLEGRPHARGGLPLHQAPPLWTADYDMQSEYAEVGTIVHEFAHGLGLPDLYARSTQNSTGLWELMSEPAAPLPQNLSAWSRLMLGWLRPRVVLPPEAGGARVQSAYLRRLDDPLDPPDVARAKQAAGLFRAILVVLPPKLMELELTDLPTSGGRVALYSGQGNQLDRTAELRLDLRGFRAAKAVELTFDAWWEIEPGWDFAYVETSADGGRTWTRRLPRDPRFMPARHGHDGPGTRPGFSGLSGDLDADGRNEGHPGCDPARPLATGEERASVVENPCLVPSWVKPAFDLTDLAGRAARLRFRYVTDLAAVQRGFLVDNVRVTVDGAPEYWDGFEGDAGRGWRLDGFLPSPGHHELLVPHYYLLEWRDPYARTPGDHRYDAALAEPTPRFYADPRTGEMLAVDALPAAGLVAWYYDGAHAWSENDPVDHGQGRGFLLALDAHPNELRLPGLEPYFRGREEAWDTHYDLGSPAAQAALEAAFVRTQCFVRPARYRPSDLFDRGRPGGPARFPGGRLPCPTAEAPLDAWRMADGRPLRAGVVVGNELLPGEARAAVQRTGDLLDYRRGDDGRLLWRLRDRSLRGLHMLDAPFALVPRGGLARARLDPATRTLVPGERHPFTAVTRFQDTERGRWMNPHLFFGGVDVPGVGFGFELAEPKPDAPAGAQAKVWLTWER